jgi:hypothetical protein
MKDLIFLGDLVDIKPIRGHSTYTNNPVGYEHIVAHLDRFLIHISFLERTYSTSSRIILWATYDH